MQKIKQFINRVLGRCQCHGVKLDYNPGFGFFCRITHQKVGK